MLVLKSCVCASDASVDEGHTCGHLSAEKFGVPFEPETESKHPDGEFATVETSCALKFGCCAHLLTKDSKLTKNGSGTLTSLMLKGATLDIVVCDVNAGGEASRCAHQVWEGKSTLCTGKKVAVTFLGA